jgi:PIN domain nuclease of toxin-antitoxin system
MRFLLDTHTFIWWNLDLPPLPARILALIVDPQNTILLSLVSVWEMQVKLQVGKLTLPTSLPEIIEKQSEQLQLLPMTLAHIFALEQLPMNHRDPFDRLLIAQAQVEDIPLLTHDTIFAKYPIRVVW